MFTDNCYYSTGHVHVLTEQQAALSRALVVQAALS